MSYSQKVLEFATKAHEGQVRKYSGIPYITHPIAVAQRAIHIANVKFSGLVDSQIEIIKSISYNHDVPEDTKFTIDDINDLLDSLGVASLEKFLITDAIQYLTKPKSNFDLIRYLERIKNNSYALVVKLADLEHNMSDLKDQKKLDYYKLIKYFLEN